VIVGAQPAGFGEFGAGEFGLALAITGSEPGARQPVSPSGEMGFFRCRLGRLSRRCDGATSRIARRAAVSGAVRAAEM
jgi:hypothetical protein